MGGVPKLMPELREQTCTVPLIGFPLTSSRGRNEEQINCYHGRSLESARSPALLLVAEEAAAYGGKWGEEKAPFYICRKDSSNQSSRQRPPFLTLQKISDGRDMQILYIQEYIPEQIRSSIDPRDAAM